LNRIFYISTIILSLIVFGTSGCKSTKYVPADSYLLKRNKVELDNKKLQKNDFYELIQQMENHRVAGIKIRLFVYNTIDDVKVDRKRLRKNESIRIQNKILQQRQNKINDRRIDQAKRKNREWYTQKIIPLKDTVSPSLFFREWLKYKFGEPPVIFDSILYKQTIEQLNLFLHKKGYYYGAVQGNILHKKNKKVSVIYTVHTGECYTIDSVDIQSVDKGLILSYERAISKGHIASLIGQPLDTYLLNTHRNEITEWMRNDAFYGFNFSNVDYIVDTTMGNFKSKVTIRFSQRQVQSSNIPDSIEYIPFRSYRINDVFFHIMDTSMVKGNYADRVAKRGLFLQPASNSFPLLDTLKYEQIYLKKYEKKRYGIPHKQKVINELRTAHFFYNGKIFVRPGIIELQNYLEHTNYYKQEYFDLSYSRLLQIDLFSSIRPQLVELPNSNMIDIHYYLTPLPRQYISIEPKATNSNGFLGVSASLNYSNRNFFRGAEKFVFALSGGFESEPPIFDTSIDGKKIIATRRSLNTFEFEPNVRLDLPGLFPIFRATHMRKRQRARTILSASWNFQNRSDFKRRSLQFGYTLRFYSVETQVFTIGLPLVAGIKFVRIEPSEDFTQKINTLNDLFLRNTYSNQFIWQDAKIIYEYNTTDRKNKIKRSGMYYKLSFDLAGNILSLFHDKQDTNSIGQRTFLGLGYSQFARLDNDLIFALPFNKKHSFHFRILLGMGLPYGNTKTSLPYDYGFFGGGANDNRGWRARALGPGAYKYYLDSNRTAIQIGDVRIGGFFEYRFDLGGYLKGAVFSDIGNIWTWNNDVNRENAQFTEKWFTQLAFSAGIGLRLDLGFVVGRVDLGYPLRNPALPKGSQWFFQNRKAFNQEINSIPNIDRSKVPKPFIPVAFLAIGYPF